MSNPIEVTLNNQHCFKPVEHIGKTVYHNICTEMNPATVYWGSLEWAAFFLLAIVLVAASGFILWTLIDSIY